LHLGPGLGEALVGGPPEQLDVGCHQLVGLELVELIAVLGLERPAAAIDLPDSTQILEDPVGRYELSHHELAHSNLLSPQADENQWNIDLGSSAAAFSTRAASTSGKSPLISGPTTGPSASAAGPVISMR